VEQTLLLPGDMADLRSMRKHEVFLSLKRDLALVSPLTTLFIPFIIVIISFILVLILDFSNLCTFLSFVLLLFFLKAV